MKERELVFFYINSKTEMKDRTQSLVNEGKRYYEDQEVREFFNKNIHSVFTVDDTRDDNIFFCTGISITGDWYCSK